MAKVPDELDVESRERALKGLVDRILDEAASQGATGAEVGVSEDTGLAVAARLGEIETVEFNRDRGFGITVYVGTRKGHANTSDSSESAIEETVRAAMNIARYTEPDPCNGLADPERMAATLPELDLHHPWDLSVDDARDRAIEAEASALQLDSRIVNSDGAQVSTQSSCRVYGNSHGFNEATRATRHGVSVVAIAEDETGMQRDYWYTVARDSADLESHIAVGEEAARRALARLGARSVKTGTYPVIFNPQMAMGLISHLVAAISGGSLYRKSSYLVDSLGKRVATGKLTLQERPHIRKALGSAAFDGEGVATTAKTFIEDGVVSSYVLSSYSACKLGLVTTGNAGGVFNLIVVADQQTPEALMEEMGTGLVVTEVMGQGINLVTGDYSRGAAGYWVENGNFAFPVEEITIASNLRDIFDRIGGFGDDVDLRGNVRTGSILVDSMTVAG